MIIIGLDLSLTSTGICTIETITETPTVSRIKPRTTGHERLEQIIEAIAGRVGCDDLAVTEGPSYGSTGGSQHERGGLWWLVAHRLWQMGVDTAVVSPSARAKYATGKGNAGKDAVLAAVVRRYTDVDVTGNDEADSLVLAAMGARHLGQPIETSLPALNLEAMAKVAWPVGVS